MFVGSSRIPCLALSRPSWDVLQTSQELKSLQLDVADCLIGGHKWNICWDTLQESCVLWWLLCLYILHLHSGKKAPDCQTWGILISLLAAFLLFFFRNFSSVIERWLEALAECRCEQGPCRWEPVWLYNALDSHGRCTMLYNYNVLWL